MLKRDVHRDEADVKTPAAFQTTAELKSSFPITCLIMFSSTKLRVANAQVPKCVQKVALWHLWGNQAVEFDQAAAK